MEGRKKIERKQQEVSDVLSFTFVALRTVLHVDFCLFRIDGKRCLLVDCPFMNVLSFHSFIVHVGFDMVLSIAREDERVTMLFCY